MEGSILPRELKARLDAGDKILILDVREPEEYAVANLGGKLLPLRELPARLGELDPSQEIVVLCHHGLRSAHATAYLKQMGFHRAMNLTGGIDRWSWEVDPQTPRY